jgi:hypothetical protein
MSDLIPAEIDEPFMQQSGHKIHIPPYLGWCALLEARAQRALDSWNETKINR